ncbi:MAG: GAF domain-containing protein [Mucilaginibacter sp.]|nr:GAF domain-containing protein [Mucilaginibacter sp.]
MKRLTLTLVLITLMLSAYAQSKKIDTLRVALSKATQPDTVRLKILHELVRNYFISKPDSCLLFAQESYDIAVKYKRVKDQAQALNGMANSYTTLGDYAKGFSLYFKSIRLFETLNDVPGVVIEYSNIGSGYTEKQEYLKALPYLQTGLKKWTAYLKTHKPANHTEKEEGPILFLNIGEVFLYTHQIDSADHYLQLSYADSKKNNYVDLLGNIERDLGEIEVARKHKDAALHYFRHSIPYSVTNEDAEMLSVTYLSIANLYHLYKQQDSAEYYATKDSLYSQDKVKQLLSLDFDEKQRLKEIEANKAETRNTIRFYVLLAGLAILLLLVIIFWFANKQRKRAYNLLQRQKQETDLQRTKVEHTLEELNATQTQLVQSYNNITVLSQIGKEITSTLDLDTILNTVYQKVNELMDASVFGIGIFIPEEESIYYRMAIEDGKRYTPYRRKMDNKNQLPVWCIENNKEVFINNVRKEYTNYISEYAEVIDATLDDGSRFKSPVSLIYLPLTVEEKVIGLITVQSFKEDAYTQRHLDILKTLASYTAAALYNASSFEKLQTTVNELQLTQKQLIQSEKMASLGELTAGIAHEIQNPLNFVNNFSEVNKELLVELKEQVDKGDLVEIRAIANNLIENEEKVSHHGKRADFIVKGMLQHSRASTGEKQSTNINTLADEFFKLSYHGLRAKDKSFNSEMSTHFDEKLPKVPVVQQDMGRVLLNLFNNAFYAVNQKTKTAGRDYKPSVEVSTAKENGSILIKVKDNGNGISDAIKDKIMQPFFTTKPTGEGTGLGLSISYDIVVKGHGGSIEADSKENIGSEFIIKLPAT